MSSRGTQERSSCLYLSQSTRYSIRLPRLRESKMVFTLKMDPLYRTYITGTQLLARETETNVTSGEPDLFPWMVCGCSSSSNIGLALVSSYRPLQIYVSWVPNSLALLEPVIHSWNIWWLSWPGKSGQMVTKYALGRALGLWCFGAGSFLRTQPKEGSGSSCAADCGSMTSDNDWSPESYVRFGHWFGDGIWKRGWQRPQQIEERLLDLRDKLGPAIRNYVFW